MERNNLAIVIPAFKDTFLRETLDSLAQQTNQEFNVYIGDDNSPYELFKIVQEYEDKLKLVYHKFDENLGSKNLVDQWNRCLGLIGSEDWFMLFSDDDVLSNKSVESLLPLLDKAEFDVYHFNLKIINENSELLAIPSAFDTVLSSADFFDQLFKKMIDARMPEFIFRKTHFDSMGGFQSFDLAMYSDTATVMKCALRKGIMTIEEGDVYWRVSSLNVSNGANSPSKYIKFYRSLVIFFNWRDSFYRDNLIYDNWGKLSKLDYLFNYGYNLKESIGLFNFLRIFNNYKLIYFFPFSIIDYSRLLFYKVKKRFS